jgi:hypothetical protein
MEAMKLVAGRPRTKAKRVRKLLERHQKLTEELRTLGKHHMPAAGEPWDFDVPGGDVDPIPPLWREAVFQANRLEDYLDDLLCFLELKVEKAEQSASVYGVDAADGLDDEEDAQTYPAEYNAASPTNGKQIATHMPAAEPEPTAQADGSGHGELAVAQAAESPVS